MADDFESNVRHNVLIWGKNGEEVGIILDGSVYRLQQVGKLLNTADAQIDPATEGKQTDAITILTAVRDTAGIKKITDPLPAGTNLLGDVQLRGGGNVALVGDDGRLQVTAIGPTPSGYTKVDRTAQSTMSGNSVADLDYVVPDGKILTIQQFFAGGEIGIGKASKFELYHSTDGGATDGVLIVFGYIGGSNNVSSPLNEDITGAGVTQVVRLRRERLDGGSLELSAGWFGIQTV